MKDDIHQLESSNETLFLVTNVRSLRNEAKSSCSKTPLAKPKLFATKNPTSSSENESSKTKVQKQPQRKSKLKAKTAMSKSEDNLSSESETGNPGKEPIKLGPMKYGCPFCSKTMPIPCNMKMHISTHTGEKPFSCNECGKAFNVKQNLIRHTMIHTGEKPFSCEFCEYSCIQKGDLKKHVKNIHTTIQI